MPRWHHRRASGRGFHRPSARNRGTDQAYLSQHLHTFDEKRDEMIRDRHRQEIDDLIKHARAAHDEVLAAS